MTVRGCPSICLGPNYGKYSRHVLYVFLSLILLLVSSSISSAVILMSSPSPTPSSNMLNTLLKSPASQANLFLLINIIFLTTGLIIHLPDWTTLLWPCTRIPGIPAEMPVGVHLARDGDVPTTTPPPNKDTHKLDWLQMADGAMANADLQDSDLLPSTAQDAGINCH